MEARLDLTMPQAQEQGEPFVIDNQEKAAWAMRKLAKIRQKQAENAATAKAMTDELNSEIQRITDWLREVNQEEEGRASYFAAGLEEYYKRWLEENPKARTKTIKLPHGQLKSREQKPEYKIDNVRFLQWLKANRPELVKSEVVETPSWADLKPEVIPVKGKAVVEGDGTVIDGVTVTERPPRFEIVTD